MREYEEEFMNGSYCSRFSTEVLHAERILHHALDNYGMVMPENLEQAVKEAEIKLKQIQKEINNWNNCKK